MGMYGSELFLKNVSIKIVGQERISYSLMGINRKKEKIVTFHITLSQ